MKRIIILSSIVIAAAALVFAAEEASTSAHKVIRPTDLHWGEAPPGLPAGANMAVLYGDPGQAGPFTARLKAPAGYKIMPHTHPTAERLTVIAGGFKIGMGEKFDESSMQIMTPGSYVVMLAGMAHFAKSNRESIVQIDSEGPFQINYVNPQDDPRNAAEKKQ